MLQVRLDNLDISSMKELITENPGTERWPVLKASPLNPCAVELTACQPGFTKAPAESAVRRCLVDFAAKSLMQMAKATKLCGRPTAAREATLRWLSKPG